ncbi:LacI family DNA-binding transcriptional regulator [Salinibacterium sp. ZJ454]|uniref:LacI family DNA-binding transcriptional regulator n=1 Tax=Salinibacterium sp. ZJ454 TaxID=2708339 RepID=UPI0032644D0D
MISAGACPRLRAPESVGRTGRPRGPSACHDESVAPLPEGFSPPTILDVARRAGVSRTTVSRVLNEPDSVSKDALVRVQQAAAELNYVPSSVARSLRSGRSGTIALLVRDFAQPFNGALAKAVAHAADTRGLNVVLADLGSDDDRLAPVVSRLSRQGVDGIIIATGDDVASGAVYDALAAATARGIAVGITVGDPGDLDISALRVDYRQVGAAATAHLVERGARNIVLLPGPTGGFHSGELRDGYLQSITGHGPERVAWTGYSYDDSLRALTSQLSSDPVVDGIVVGTVPIALGAIRALEAFGLRVPGDVALISCEELPLARHARPAISSMAIDIDRVGHEMVRMVSVAMGGGMPEPIALHPLHIPRETS